MFVVEKEIISSILKDYSIQDEIERFSELQRYHYEKDDPGTKEVRLIIKVEPFSFWIKEGILLA